LTVDGPKEDPLSTATPPPEPKELLTDSDGMSRDMNNLGKYQQQQKMMEELNKRKKQMLAQALFSR